MIVEAEVLGSLLSGERDELFALLLEERGIELADEPALGPRKAGGEAPLSFAQERLWLLDRMQPGNPAYNIAVAVRLSGALNRRALERSWCEIVRRHEALRTFFPIRSAAPVQAVFDGALPPCGLVDLDGLPEEQRQRWALALLEREALRPFDLATGPLFRFLLVRLGAREHIVLLMAHHIISDGWSMGIMTEELTALYPGFVRGIPVALPELPIQYADFAVWQRAELAGPALKSRLQYWKARFAGEIPWLALPASRPRKPVQTFAGASQPFSLPAPLVLALRALSQRSGCTLFMTLLAAFNLLLYRHTAQSDIVVGTAIAGRDRKEIERLIGFFVNTLALRTDLSGAPGFRELLDRVRRATLDDFSHQDLPFAKLIEELNPERRPSHSPLFQVMFELQNAPVALPRLSGLSLERLALDNGTAKFDLTLRLEDGPGKIAGALEHNRDLFEAAGIERMAGHLTTLLAGIVEDPERPIAELELLSEAERRQLTGWNDTASSYPRQLCLHQLIAAQAARAPQAVAVVAGAESLTYGELNLRANHLAHRLRAAGVGPEVLVALCAERSLDMMVALLAVLKAGGAYVPLDPAYPPERLAFMLEDSRAALLLTQKSLGAVLPRPLAGGGARVLYLDGSRKPRAAAASLDPVGGANPGNLAYVIYTSGSTGRPKGVAVPHRALINFLAAMRCRPGLSADDVLVAVTPLSFDIAGLELFLPLLVGGRVVLASRQESMDVRRLAALLDRVGGTVLQATPATWRLLVEVGWLGPVKALCGGEGLPADLAEELCQRADEAWNLYGPTETTVWSTFERLSAGRPPAIGRPIANTRVYLINTGGRPVPVGVVGELWIAGDGLARGYWGRPELTAEQFMPDPFGDEPGARLYRTGDLARYRPDGSIECLGRIDHQVKVHGFRIEPGEIETAIARHPAVLQTAVVARAAAGDQRLVAYAVLRPASELALDELRDFLAASLPAHMLPSALVLLAALPLTANGKLDRAALPAPQATRPELAAGFEAPRNETERTLADLWLALLPVDKVGAHDNFFALGGHSLLATQLMLRIEETFGVELPLLTLFELPTVAGLAPRLELALSRLQVSLLPPLRPVSRQLDLPLSFAQQRLWFLEQLEGPGAVYNMAGMVRLNGRLDTLILRRALGEILRRHEILRTTFHKAEGRPVVCIHADHPRPEMPVIVLDGLALPDRDEEVARLAAAEARRPFDLESGPLLRVHLLRLEEAQHVLLVTVHHIVADGWSIGLVLSELVRLYDAFAAGHPSPLPELPVQYVDFAVWQRQCLEGEAMAAQLDYWKEQLRGACPALALPTDHPYPVQPTYRGGRALCAVDGALGSGLQALSRGQGATLFMTLLAAFEGLLYRYTEQRDFAVGSPIAGRNRGEVQGLIGFFVNTLVLRADLSGRPGGRELLGRVQRTALGAYAHQELPFQFLVEALPLARDLKRSPLFQVMFVWGDVPVPLPSASGLELIPSEAETGTAKFELTLALHEAGGGALRGSLEYSTDLFEEATVERMAGHLKTLLAGIVAEPDRPVAELALLSAAERQQLVSWNDTADPRLIPQDGAAAGLHELIAAQALRTPERPAVSFEGETLTYGELLAAARRLARRLCELGVGADVAVAVYADRSLEMVVGLLGVLEAGGAYLPLDPGYPADRLAYMLADAAVPVVLIQERLRSLLPPYEGVVVALDGVTIGEPAGAVTLTSLGKPVAPPVEPGSLAYIIYTSGSTGRPKGTMNTHRGIVNRLLWMQNQYGLAAEDRVLQKTPFSFDVSVWEFFWPLLVGAHLVMARPGGHKDPAYLVETIVGEAITTIHFVPSMLRVFVDAPGVERCTSLRRVMASGETLAPEVVKRFYRRLNVGGVGLHNLYGPTEAAVDVTFHECVRETAAATVPIGRPVANTRILILDREGAPVPLGVCGELHIGGVQLARGYLARPDLTAERFVPDPSPPMGGEPGGRLYRTGDLAALRPDGNLEYLGRADRQVKIRGYRIELGEIEEAMARHPAVREAVALVLDREGDRRVAAYVVTQPDNGVTLQELRDFLARSLPEPMLPSVFVPLAAMPLTANGKLDRQALPQPQATRPDLPQEIVAPRTDLERTLAEIWLATLPVDRIGIHDNFFDLGGHSLLAVRLMALIKERLGAELPLSSLFRGATIEQMARLVARNPGAALWSSLVEIQSGGSQPPFFCVHPTGGDVLCYGPQSQQLGPDYPFYGLQAQGLDGRHELFRTIPDMAAHYIAAIRAVRPEGPYLLGGWSFGGVVIFEMAQQLRRQGQEVTLLAVLDSLAPVSAVAAPAMLSRAEWAAWFMFIGGEFEDAFKRDLGMSVGELEQLDPDQQMAYFVERLGRADFLPAQGGMAVADRYRRVHEANTVALLEYASQAQPYPGPITLFRSIETHALLAESWSRESHDDVELGWSRLADGPLVVHPVPGNHNKLLRSPNLEVVAAQLAAEIMRAAANRQP